jgi:hypothetical protein
VNSSTGAGEEIWKDAYTGSIVQIDIAHAAIHLGKYFSHSGIVNVANGASFNHLFIPPSPGGKFIHLRLFILTSSAAPIEHRLFEGTTVSANGTAQTGYNFNRNHANATMPLYHTPTITADGTAIHTNLTSGSKQAGGAGETSGTEWVLVQGTTYMSRITNVSGAAADVGYTMEWYEL